MMTVIVGEPVLLRAVKKRDGDKEETGQDRYHHDVDEEEEGDDFGLFLVLITHKSECTRVY